MMVPSIVVLFLAFAQSPAELFQKAPPHIDEALRARISEFYQAHVDGRFRDAYELVAEDSKDIFFAAEKPRYRSYSILRISYEEDFTKARAVVACESEVGAFGTKFVAKVPTASLWKEKDGQWYWYALPSEETVETPMGMMRPGPMPAEGASQAGVRAPNVAELRNLVKLSKTEVNLSTGRKSADEIVVSNHLPGYVQLSVEHLEVPGLEIKLDQQQLEPGGTTVLSFRLEPSGEPPKDDMPAYLIVMPTGQTIPIRVGFRGVPAER